MENWVDDYLVGWRLGNELKIYRDFEVVSFIGIRNQWVYTVDHLLQVDVGQMIEYQTATETLNALIKLIPKDAYIYITSTPIESDLANTHFYKMNLPLRIDYAIQVGLGVARSTYDRKEYCLYPITSDKSMRGEDRKTIELLRLKLYTQLIKGKTAIDPSLRALWQSDKQQLIKLLFADIEEVTTVLDQLFLE